MRSIACMEKRTVQLELCRNTLIECGAPIPTWPARKGSICLLSNQPSHATCSGTTNDAQRTMRKLPLHTQKQVDLVARHACDGIRGAVEAGSASRNAQQIHEETLIGSQKHVVQNASCVASPSPNHNIIGLRPTSNYCG